MIREKLSHRSAIARTVHHPFGTFSPESLGDMATPANRQVGFKQLRQILGSNVAPLHGLSLRAHQCGPVVVPMQLQKGFVAVCASPAPIPVGDYGPHQTALWVGSKLAETLLTAVLALWPTRTFAQVDFGAASQGTASRGRSRDSHTSSSASFGTTEQHPASIPEEHTRSVCEPNGHGCHENRKSNHDEEINRRCHIQLLGSHRIFSRNRKLTQKQP